MKSPLRLGRCSCLCPDRAIPSSATTTEWQRWKAGKPQETLDKFRGMTLPVDEGVGQIRAGLEKHGIDKNTVIHFFTDNGPTPEAPSGCEFNSKPPFDFSNNR